MMHPNAFFWPVINNVLYAAQRNTPPHTGLWGAVGEKLEQASSAPAFAAQRVRHPHAHRTLTAQGIESVVAAAKRGLSEEVYGSTLRDEDFSDVFEIGYADDKSERLFHVIGRVHRSDWQLNKRELAGFEPVRNLRPSVFYPAAQASLIHLRHAVMDPQAPEHQYSFLASQIPAIAPSREVEQLGGNFTTYRYEDAEYIPSETDIVWAQLRATFPSASYALKK